MSDNISPSILLTSQELNALFDLGGLTTQEIEIERALELAAQLLRPVLIFDNFVVYVTGEGGLEAIYARIVGRGRAAEAELEWGEEIAGQVVDNGNTHKLHDKLDGWQENRLNWRDMLALPLSSPKETFGAMVLGRFGGPAYTEAEIRLAKFAAMQISQLLLHKKLVERVAALEAEKRLQTLQENFIATISHELKSPLGFIKGYTTTLMRDDANWSKETRSEFLQIINEEADRLGALIENLLDSSRVQAGRLRIQKQSLAVDVFLQEFANRMRGFYRQVEFSLQVGEAFHIFADPTRLFQVLENLVSNAIKYAPTSPITIGAELTTDESMPGGQAGKITVRDCGPGIPVEHQERIFERFYRIPENSHQARGTGLGLYICSEIIQAHGGRLFVRSAVGEFSEFCILLPVDATAQPQIEEQ